MVAPQAPPEDPGKLGVPEGDELLGRPLPPVGRVDGGQGRDDVPQDQQPLVDVDPLPQAGPLGPGPLGPLGPSQVDEVEL